MNKILLSLTLLITPLTNVNANVHDVFKKLDDKPLRSASTSTGLKAIYAMCDSGGITTMYRVQRTQVRGTGNIRYLDHIYLILYNGDWIPVSRSDCKFFYIR